MGRLDNQLQPGDQIAWDHAYHNELVDKLARQPASGRLRVETSTSRAVVSSDDTQNYPLFPSAVRLRDATEWNGLDQERVRIDWTLSGIGHLVGTGDTRITEGETLTRGPRQEVQWTWSDTGEGGYTARNWNEDFPINVEIQASAYRLTYDTTLPSVADIAARDELTPSSGDSVLVRSESKVYSYDGEDWTEVTEPVWSLYDTSYTYIHVERAYDPAYEAGTQLRLEPEREVVPVEEGGSVVRVEDRSSFDDSIDRVERTVTAHYVDTGDEANITYNEDASTDLLELSEADRRIEIIGEQAGQVRLVASYVVVEESTNVESTYETTRVIRFTPASAYRARLLASVDPVPPSHLKVTPGNGSCHLDLALPIDVESVERTMRTPASGGTVSTEQAAQLIARLYGSPEITIEGGEVGQETYEHLAQMARLAQHFTDPSTDSGLHTYRIVLSRGDQRIGEVPNGALLRTSQGLMRLTQKKALDSETYEFIGQGLFADPESLTEGEIVGNGDWISVRCLFEYGDPDAESFPTKTYHTEELLDPLTSQHNFDVSLPNMRPSSIRDGWYVTVEADATWADGSTDRTTLSRTRAEVIPDQSPSVSYERSGDEFNVKVEGDYDFFGELTWTTEASPESTPEADVSRWSQVPTRLFMPSRLYDGARILARGHFRTRGGTCQPQTTAATSDLLKPAGVPVITAGTDSPTPDAIAPATNGVWYKMPTKSWMSLGGEWVLVSQDAATQSPVESVQVTAAAGSITFDEQERTSATTWESVINYETLQNARTSSVEVKVLFRGGIASAERAYVSTNKGTFNEENQTLRMPVVLSSSQETTDVKFKAVDHNGTTHRFEVNILLERGTDHMAPQLDDVRTEDTLTLERNSDSMWTASYSDQTSDTFTLRLYLSDSSGIASVTPESVPSYYQTHWNPDERIYTLQGQKDEAALKIKATDNAGNEKVFIIDVRDGSPDDTTPPRLVSIEALSEGVTLTEHATENDTWTASFDGATFSHSFTTRFVLSDGDSGIDTVVWTNQSGSSSTMSETAAGEYNVSVAPEEGTASLTATDKAGNSKTYTLIVDDTSN